MSLFESLLDEDVLGRRAGAGTVKGPNVSKREVHIAIRRDGVLGDGTAQSPFDGTNRDRLDGILNGDFDNTLRTPVRLLKLDYVLTVYPGTTSGEIWLDKVSKTATMHVQSIEQNDVGRETYYFPEATG